MAKGLLWGLFSLFAFELNGALVAAIGTAIVGVIGGVTVLLRTYLPHKIQLKRIDLDRIEKELHVKEVLIDELRKAMAGYILLHEDCQRDKEEQRQINLVIYDVLGRWHKTMIDSGLDPGSMPSMPVYRERETKSTAHAKYLLAEGEQALNMLDESIKRSSSVLKDSLSNNTASRKNKRRSKEATHDDESDGV